MMTMHLLLTTAMLLFPAAEPHLAPDHPSTAELRVRYERANEIASAYRRSVYNLRLTPSWIGDDGRFWYQSNVRGRREFLLIDPIKASKTPAFDHARLAAALSKATDKRFQPYGLPFQSITLDGKTNDLEFDFAGKHWTCHLADYSLASKVIDARPVPPEEPWSQNLWPPDPNPSDSPDHRFKAQIVDWNIRLSEGAKPARALTTDGAAANYFARLLWSPDSKALVAIRVVPGDRKKVYLIQSTPDPWGPAVLKERVYDRPGDRVDTFQLRLVNPNTGSMITPKVEDIDYGDMPDLHWQKDGRHFTYEKMDRGYGRYRIIRVDSLTGASEALVDEQPSTFVDSTSQFVYYGRKTDEMIYRSERDGFGRIYLVSPTGAMSAMTPPTWVVREVVHVDEDKRRVFFAASGMSADEDPYFIHYFRVDFDGKNLTALTPERGNHTASFSPDYSWLVDSFSQVDVPTIHQLRSDVGAMRMELERADVGDLKRTGLVLPEPFVTKGRDGKTDIYGVIYRPTYFDPQKRYPVLEDIYAGPQDSFVPKSFGEMGWDHAMAELGFIVVKIDGMGTRNRGKAFQDVCYKNLADAGFPDRILWMRALHEKYPYADITRVGAYGTSAGGQSAAGSVLFHPEFYKAAVASCGCHDNRLDKAWWNEQWMGKIGPHYEQQSNITNASKLKGSLLLIVGELDTNVPPESTYRLAAALQAANKEFDLVIIPNSDHTAGGTYGERKRRDFFVRRLIGVEPPAWNE